MGSLRVFVVVFFFFFFFFFFFRLWRSRILRWMITSGSMTKPGRYQYFVVLQDIPFLMPNHQSSI
jgi:hypothetical protein